MTANCRGVNILLVHHMPRFIMEDVENSSLASDPVVLTYDDQIFGCKWVSELYSQYPQYLEVRVRGYYPPVIQHSY